MALWCSLSVTSRWVREEVHLAHDLGVLVPVKIELCEIPLGFRLADTIDLSGWDGAPRSPALDPLIDALEGRIGRDAAPDRKALIEYEATWRRFGARTLKDFALNTKLAQAEARRFGPDESNGPDNGLLQWSKEEWERLKASADVGRLLRFAEHAHPYYAADAREEVLRLQAEAERERKAKEERERAEAARRVAEQLARLEAQQAEERKRQEQEARRIRVSAAIAMPAVPARLERFLPGAGKDEGFKDLDIGPEMVVVPAGSFMMGSPPSEPERSDDEGPQHKVAIAKPFAVGRFAVTFAEWDAAQQDRDWQAVTARAARQPAEEGWGRGDRPVIDVEWDDAKAYAKWLSKKTGKDYRLPSEAEWEYACRAGTTTPFWWGSSITPDQANYDGSADPYKGGGKKGEDREKTLPVKSFEPNPWGLYQVHGNVWEWCEDLWHGNYNGAPQDGSAWTAGDSIYRVLRGGSWGDDPLALRSAYHSKLLWGGFRFRGFRVVMTLPSSS